MSNAQPSSTNSYVTDRFTKKDDKEHRYEQIFPPYHPNKPYVLHFVNSLITEQELKHLCTVINNTMDFIFDTESDYHTKMPALIQILIVQPDPQPSLLLLIETNHLPNSSSSLFLGIQHLLHAITRTGTYLYAWGSLLDELERFKIYQFFSMSISSHIINVQRVFTGWFNEYLNEQSRNNNNNTTADDNSLVLKAPEFNPELFLPPAMINRLKVMNNQLWSLQDAIAYLFYQYLSKRDTLRSWSIGLDKRLSSCNKNFSLNYRRRLITYASFDCLSLMNIMLFMHENYLSNCPVNDQPIESLGKYFFYLSSKFSSVSPARVKSRPVVEILLSDESDDSMTVHDLNERHQIPFETPVNQQPSTIIHQHHESDQIYNFNVTYQVSDESRSFNQHYHITEYYEITDLTPSDTQCLTTAQASTDHQLFNEINVHDQIDNHFNPNDNHQDMEPNHDPQVTNLNNNDVPPLIQTKRKRRSSASQKRRNQRSSLRHRKNRYNFGISRTVNTTITNVKRILRSHAVPYQNVNIVKSKLYIGFKSKDLEQYFEQLLPLDIFL
ncbi:unnamed protein product [Rotaria sp. Silwood2]|nr:unnamed protein product [Rotaria sp. Silwood2]CAF4231732.1 unnamed protein product [Rotaria sp. Silwood2]